MWSVKVGILLYKDHTNANTGTIKADLYKLVSFVGVN